MQFKRILLATALLSGVSAFSATIHGLTYADSGEVVPGEWNSQYDKVMDKAKAEGMPVVGIWVSSACTHCQHLLDAINTAEMKAWLKDRGYLCLLGIKGQKWSENTKNLIKYGANYPYVGVCWDKNGDGTVETLGKWCGRTGQMPVKASSLGAQFKQSVEKYLGTYTSTVTTTFDLPDTAENRLEFESGTKSVKLAFVRDSVGKEVSFTLRAAVGTKVTTKNYSWNASDKAMRVDFDVTGFTGLSDGDLVKLEIVGDQDKVTSTVNLAFVSRANAASNPDWLGASVEFGRWTMDIDGAKALVEKRGGYTLVGILGSKWCPDCANTDRNFLDVTDKDGQNLVRAWAASNKVALVTLDIPNFTGPKATDFATPCLLTTNAYETTLARAKEYPNSGADASLTNKIVRSGLGYLSRKGVTPEQAAAQLEKFHAYASKNTDEGGFHRPEDDNKNRTGVPIFVLLRADGTVAARLTRFAAVSPMADDRAKVADFLKRFDEMLAIAGTGDHGDATEIDNNYPCAKSLALPVSGSASNELSHADFQDTFRFVDAEGMSVRGSRLQKVTVSGESDARVTVQFYQKGEDGEVSTFGGEKSGALSAGLALEGTFDASSEYYLMVKGADITDAAFSVSNVVENHFTAYTVASEVLQYVPFTAEAKGITSAERKANVLLMENAVYRFTGLDASRNGTYLAVLDGASGLYQAKVSGGHNLVFTNAQATFSYQQWKPGQVAFESNALIVPVSVNDRYGDAVALPVQRTGGASGAVTVRVTADTNLTTFAGYEIRTPELTWADGETDDKDVLIHIKDETGFKGPELVVLDLAVTSGSASLGANGRFALTVTSSSVDPSKANYGKAMVSRAEPFWAKKGTVYAREGEGAKLWLARVDGSDNLVQVELKSSVSGVGYAVENPRDITNIVGKTYIYWSHTESDEKYVRVSGIPAGKTAKVTLGAYDKFKVVAASNAVSVVSVADDAPGFASSSLAFAAYLNTAVSNRVAMSQTEGGKLTFKKLDGSLPSGLSLAYDDKTQSVILSGAPTKAGTFRAVYQVSEKRGSKTVAGMPAEIAVTVVDPAADGTGPEGEPLNDSCKVSRTLSDLMLVDADLQALGGTVTVTLPPNGRASAKVVSMLGSVSLSAKNWTGLDESTGVRRVVLTGTFNKRPVELDVRANRDGSVKMTLSGLSNEWTAEFGGRAWSKSYTAKDYQGYYTVALPRTSVKEGSGEVAPGGDAYLTLKFTSASAWNTGKVTWTGVLPNGTAVSGSAVLSEYAEGDVAYLPLVKVSGKEAFTAVAEIAANVLTDAEEAIAAGDEVCLRAVTLPKMQVGDMAYDIAPYWQHTESATVEGTFVARYGLYGSIYLDNFGLDCCCEAFTGTTNMYFEVTAPKACAQGSIDPVDPVPVTVGEKSITIEKGVDNPNQVKLTVSRSTGIVTGSFKLSAGGKSVSATYKGVVLPGWSSACGCEDAPNLPFVCGAFTFSDKLSYSASGKAKTLSVKRGGRIAVVKDPQIEE